MTPHILIVEDSRTQALRFQLELQRCGARVDIARDGIQGWECARALRPKAIVLDIDLPGMDGYTLCQRALTSSVAMPASAAAKLSGTST